MGAKGRNVEKGLDVKLNEATGGKSICLSVQGWESEKHKSWSMSAEGFSDHVTTDGS